MEADVLEVRFPRGSVPARGFRCPVCREEVLPLASARKAEALAARLGLYGVQHRQRRRLQRTGNSVTVSLSPAWLRRHGARPGDEVVVGELGDALVVLPAAAEEP